MVQMNKNEFLGIDVSTLPEKEVEVLIDIVPKVECKNKLVQKIFTKLFGYKPIYEVRKAKVLEMKSEDCKFETKNITIDMKNGEVINEGI